MPIPRRSRKVALASAALAGAIASSAHAAPISDPVNDFIPSFTGVKAGDLDVVSSFVNYDAGANLFTFSGTMNAPIGTTSSSTYVWGVDRGQGTARFGSLASGVLFDAVVAITGAGAGTVTLLPGAAATLPAGSVTIAGNTITALVSGALLPSNGLPLSAFTWNLWPRDTTQAGNAAISDFAPDNSNVTVTAVPEPSTVVLTLLGLAATAWRSRGRRRA